MLSGEWPKGNRQGRSIGSIHTQELKTVKPIAPERRVYRKRWQKRFRRARLAYLFIELLELQSESWQAFSKLVSLASWFSPALESPIPA